MKTKRTMFTIFLLAIMLFSACGTNKPQQPAAPAPAEAPAEISPEEMTPDSNFYYKNTKWGMTLEEIIAIRGTADLRSDEAAEDDDYAGAEKIVVDLNEGQEDEAPPEGYWDDVPDTPEPELIDFYYNDMPLFDKYTVTERFLFDAQQKLEGVTCLVDIGTVKDDLTNLVEIREGGIEKYLDLKEILTELYGQPAAEYTAYREEGEYKTKEILDFESDTAVYFTTRWDGALIGDSYRFIYISYYYNDLTLDVRYTYHSKETVDRVNQGGKP